MGTTYLPALLAASEPSNMTVVVTGFSLVFFILVLLCLIISVEGKIFAGLEAKKKAKKAPAAKSAAPAAPVKAAATAAAAPAVEKGIPAEVVAAIAAAVASMDGGKYTLRTVNRAVNGRGRGAWGNAGVLSVTEPF